jgi:hypothetical protein
VSSRSLPDFMKNIDARIALALAKALGAATGIASLQNRQSVTNPGVVGPANTLVWSGTPMIVRSGAVLVIVNIEVGGTSATTIAAGDTIQVLLLRDGVAISPLQTLGVAVAGTGGFVHTALMLQKIDLVAPGSHTWAIEAIIAAGHTGVIDLGAATVTAIELP